MTNGYLYYIPFTTICDDGSISVFSSVLKIKHKIETLDGIKKATMGIEELNNMKNVVILSWKLIKE